MNPSIHQGNQRTPQLLIQEDQRHPGRKSRKPNSDRRTKRTKVPSVTQGDQRYPNCQSRRINGISADNPGSLTRSAWLRPGPTNKGNKGPLRKPGESTIPQLQIQEDQRHCGRSSRKLTRRAWLRPRPTNKGNKGPLNNPGESTIPPTANPGGLTAPRPIIQEA